MRDMNKHNCHNTSANSLFFSYKQHLSDDTHSYCAASYRECRPHQ